MVTNAFRQFGFPRQNQKINQYENQQRSPMPFGNSGFPVRYRAKTHYFGTQPVTNAFRQFGFPRQMLEILNERSGILVTNAFRQFGFPRQILADSLESFLAGHQCLSAIRVSPSGAWEILPKCRRKCHQCLSAIRVSPSNIGSCKTVPP